MTISPPAKVKLTSENTFQVLASGIDTLDLSIDVHWKDETFFNILNESKTLAIELESAFPIKLPGIEILALIQPFGRKGHQWIVNAGDFDLTIGNWLKPKTRPSIMVHIHSEALWRVGPQEIVEYLRDFLYSAGAESLSIKPSRVDLCIDMTFSQDVWNIDLIPLRVTRSRYAAPHFDNTRMTGISIGKGSIAARLYDKELEIIKKSKKFWMYDIWNIEEGISQELEIIRVEGQFRREAIKELGIDSIEDLFGHIENLWGYFTKEWLKFQDSPGEHHTMRSTFPWWEIVQNAFLGIQNPAPLIRCKVIYPKKKQLYAQSYGTMTSLLACEHEEKGVPIGTKARINDLLYEFEYSEEIGKSDFEVETDLITKRAKINRLQAKMHQAHLQRKRLGFPSNIKPEFYTSNED